jgi:hypothetical protein
VRAAIAERLAAPGELEYLDGLVGARSALVLGHTKRGELPRLVAGSQADVQAAPAQLVDHRQVLGESERVVQRREQHRGAEPDA